MKFELFVEESLREKFGIPSQKVTRFHAPDELPIKSFDREKVLRYLTEYKIGTNFGKLSMGSVTWGTDSGAIRVSMDANFKILIQQKTEDLQGNPVWVLCKYYKIKTMEYVRKEDVVARDIMTEVEELSSHAVLSAKKEFSTDSLARKIAYRFQSQSDLFRYEKTVSQGKNKKIIQFSLNASGVGKLVKGLDHGHDSNLTPLATVTLDFNEKTGLLRTIFTTYSMDEDSNQWYIEIPYLDAYFSPNQSTASISDMICGAIKLI